MRFKKVNWLKKALATPHGFVHERTGEMLKRVRLTPKEIVEWNGWEDKVPAECKVEEKKPVKVKEEVKVEIVEKEMCDCDNCECEDCDCDCHNKDTGAAGWLGGLFD